jgi:4-amino-4-deoxy-L-arabinose transferase-like glycosyltransferase
MNDPALEVQSFDHRQGWASLRACLVALSHRRVVAAAACLFGVALFLFADLGRRPVVMWDESRLAVNALEMSLKGLSIATTYDFKADLWNTKPPLQIWLMALSLHLIPDAETALRVPSALAAFGTVLLTAAFVGSVTRSRFAALMAGVLLLSSRGFYSEHIAQTGDYDALLVFFTMAYLWLIYFALHREKPRIGETVLIGVCIAGAILTKGIAACIPAVGVLLYLTFSRRWPRVFRSPSYLLTACVALAPVIAFYALREAVDSGFLEAVYWNELRRSNVDLDPGSVGTARGVTFYAEEILRLRSFSLGPLILLVVLSGWIAAKPRSRDAINYAVIISVAFLLIISLVKTRYFWYAAPVYPWLAIASSVAIHAVIAAGRRRLPVALCRHAAPLAALGASVLLLHAIYFRHIRFEGRGDPESSYGQLFDLLSRNGHLAVTVVDPGRSDAGPVKDGHYNPILRFYALLHETRRGMLIDLRYDLPEEVDRRYPVLASCHPGVDLGSPTEARLRVRVGSCSAVLIDVAPEN